MSLYSANKVDYELTANTVPNSIMYLRVLLFVLTVIYVLYLIQPKDFIRTQVLKETKNYDLTAIYLKNMLRFSENHLSLELTMIKTVTGQGKYDLSLRLIDELYSEANLPLKKKLQLLRFDTLKVKYFSTNEAFLQELIKREMEENIDTIIEFEYFQKQDIKLWYQNAKELSLSKAALYFVDKLIKEGNGFEGFEGANTNKILLKEAYYLAIEVEDLNKAKEFIDRLAQISDIWKQERAGFYINTKKDYILAAEQYQQLFNTSTNRLKRQNYFEKTIQTYQYGGFLDQAVAFSRIHESQYYENKEISEVFIKLYLSANKLDDANRVARERLLQLRELMKMVP